MKTVYLLASLFFSSLCMATDLTDYACLHLQITVKNNTQNTCYLLTEELDNSESVVNPAHDITFKIAPNEEAPMIDIRSIGYIGGTKLELVYECGTGSYIRLHSSKTECGNTNEIEASILSAANLSATQKSTPASYWSNKVAKVHWTIE